MGVNDFSNKDPNIGSARNASTDSFKTTLAVNLLIFVVIMALFFTVRRKNRRIYAPLTCVATIEPWRKLKVWDKTKYGIVDTIEGFSGFSTPFGWMKSVWKLPDETVLRTNGLDGYLFLRYIRQSMLLCFIGVLITGIFILPFNATGGGGQSGLDMLSFSNLGKSSTKRLYVHVLISYVYFSIVLFVIYRELLYYIAIRQAYMHSDLYASRLSARTLMLTNVPAKYAGETELKAVFGGVGVVEAVWMTRSNPKLRRLVAQRHAVAMKLEAAEVALIRRADRQRRRRCRADKTAGSSARWWRCWQGSSEPKRPTHRVKWGRKVDTIDWCRAKLAERNAQVDELQARHLRGEAGKGSNSAFVAFSSQSAAQSALRLVIHDLTMQMAPRYIGVSPSEVVWENLGAGWWERKARVLGTTAFFALMTLFWSVPNALVGTLSQLDYLSEKIPFLRVLDRLPPFIVGAITGLLPPLLLSLLLEWVPKILGWLVRLSGEPSRPNIELRVQNWYFIFLVIQVFLVTTITSAASAAVTQIIKDPMSIASLLAENLPKASNFYISYMLLQGLSVSSSIVLQFAGLVLYKVLGFFLDDTPRKKWRRWSSVEDPGIGSLFPFYTNFCVIGLAYSITAPLVLFFATPGLGLVYFAYRYNFLFVYSAKVDTKGLAYPRAWKQTLTGVYLSEGCLVGLFALKKQIGPVILQVILVAVTVAFQKSLTANITTLLEHLPDLPPNPAPPTPTAAAAAAAVAATSAPSGDPEKARATFAQRTLSGISKVSSVFSITSFPQQRTTTTSFFSRLLRPELYLDHRVLEKLIPRLEDLPGRTTATATEHKYVYHHPSVTATPPVIWIPKDVGDGEDGDEGGEGGRGGRGGGGGGGGGGLAERFVREMEGVNPASCDGARLDAATGHIVVEDDGVVPPGWEEVELWGM